MPACRQIQNSLIHVDPRLQNPKKNFAFEELPAEALSQAYAPTQKLRRVKSLEKINSASFKITTLLKLYSNYACTVLYFDDIFNDSKF